MTALLPSDIATLLDAGATRDLVSDRSTARAYVKERHTHCETAFLTGSVALGTAHALSDIDLYVIDNRVAAPLREQVFYKSRPIQTTIMSDISLLAVIDRARRSGEITYLPALQSAVWIFGGKSFLRYLAEAVEKLLKAGPPIYGSAQIHRTRSLIINALIKVRDDEPLYVRYDNSAKVIANAARYLQLCAGTWLHSDIKFSQVIQDCQIYHRLMATAANVLAGDCQEFRAACHELLSAQGEVLWADERFALMLRDGR